MKPERFNISLLPREQVGDNLATQLQGIDARVFPEPSTDPFYIESGGISHIVYATQNDEVVAAAGIRVRVAGDKENEGGLVQQLQATCQARGLSSLPDGSQVVFIQNIVSLTPGGGSTLIASLPEYFPRTVMVAGTTRSTRAISARMKGLGPDFTHYFATLPIGNNSHFSEARRDFPALAFESSAKFNRVEELPYGNKTALVFLSEERLRGEFVKSTDPILAEASGIISMVEELQQLNPQANYSVPFISFQKSLL